jgi:hypothetical protein
LTSTRAASTFPMPRRFRGKQQRQKKINSNGVIFCCWGQGITVTEPYGIAEEEKKRTKQLNTHFVVPTYFCCQKEFGTSSEQFNRRTKSEGQAHGREHSSSFAIDYCWSCPPAHNLGCKTKTPQKTEQSSSVHYPPSDALAVQAVVVVDCASWSSERQQCPWSGGGSMVSTITVLSIGFVSRSWQPGGGGGVEDLEVKQVCSGQNHHQGVRTRKQIKQAQGTPGYIPRRGAAVEALRGADFCSAAVRLGAFSEPVERVPVAHPRPLGQLQNDA